MGSDSARVDIGDHEIWEQRRARLRALELVNGAQLQAESEYQVYLPLCAAVEEGNVDKFIEALEKCSAEERVSLSDIINIKGPSGNSLLHAAAGISGADILQALLEVIRDPGLAGKVTYRGDTALHNAARAGRFRTAELLLGCGGIVDVANDTGNTALHEAVKNCRYKLTRLLLSRGSRSVYQENKESKSPLYLAVEMGDLTNLKLLMEAVDGHEVLQSRMEGMSPVHGAVIHKRIEMLEERPEQRKALFCLKDAGGGTPLHLAAFVNYVNGVEFLVNKFASSAFEGDEEGYLPIHVACKMDHLEIMEKLLQLWPNPDELLNVKEGQNILHVAAKYASTSVICYILNNPKLEKLINAKDKKGNTPLHVAASQLQVDALLWLFDEAAVDLELVNNDNLTALDIADKQLKKMDAPPTAYQQLVVPLLKAVKAPRSKDKLICKPRGTDPGIDEESQHSNRLKDIASTRMIMAMLIATMTFAVGFLVPGGYNDSELDAGIAVVVVEPIRAFAYMKIR